LPSFSAKRLIPSNSHRALPAAPSAATGDVRGSLTVYCAFVGRSFNEIDPDRFLVVIADGVLTHPAAPPFWGFPISKFCALREFLAHAQNAI